MSIAATALKARLAIEQAFLRSQPASPIARSYLSRPKAPAPRHSFREALEQHAFLKAQYELQASRHVDTVWNTTVF
jgi:hypothetical protein